MRAALDFPDGDEAAAEVVRVERGRPRYGVDLDDSVIPQEAGLNERAVSFTKGCYVGQETVARLYYRGKPNRRLLGLRLSEPMEPGTELRLGEKVVGRLGSVVVSPDARTDRAGARAARGEPRATRSPWTVRRHSSSTSLSGSKVGLALTRSDRREQPMAAHVIVLANRTAAAPELIEALVHRGERGPIHATLVMPAAGPGQRGPRGGKERLDAALEAWRAAGIEQCEGVVCDPVPLEASGLLKGPLVAP